MQETGNREGEYARTPKDDQVPAPIDFPALSRAQNRSYPTQLFPVPCSRRTDVKLHFHRYHFLHRFNDLLRLDNG